MYINDNHVIRGIDNSEEPENMGAVQYCSNPRCKFHDPLPLSANFCPDCGRLLKHNHEIGFDSIGKFNEGTAVFRKNEKCGLVSKTGEIILDSIYKKVLPLSEGLSAVESDSSEWFFVDNQGNIALLLDNVYYMVSDIGFKCGLCPVGKWDEESSDILYGYIDKKGKEVIRCQYSWASDFNEHVALAVVSINDKQFAIDKLGQRQSNYFYSLSIDEDCLITFDPPRTHFLESLLTKECIPLPKVKGTELILGIGEGICSYIVEDKLICFRIDRSKERRSFKGIQCFYSHFSNGLLAVRQCYGLAGFVDSQCNIVIPLIYYDAKDFTCGLASVQSNDTLKWGYINGKGDLVIDFKFDEASQFYDDGVAIVCDGGKEMVIDLTGRIVLS